MRIIKAILRSIIGAIRLAVTLLYVLTPLISKFGVLMLIILILSGTFKRENYSTLTLKIKIEYGILVLVPMFSKLILDGVLAVLDKLYSELSKPTYSKSSHRRANYIPNEADDEKLRQTVELLQQLHEQKKNNI